MAARKVDFLLIGGGLASANCARWLRESGSDGEVMLVGREPDPPYNRPDCSKEYLRGEEEREAAYFRPAEWWGETASSLVQDGFDTIVFWPVDPSPAQVELLISGVVPLLRS